jgi:hypothetical protein
LVSTNRRGRKSPRDFGGREKQFRADERRRRRLDYF